MWACVNFFKGPVPVPNVKPSTTTGKVIYFLVAMHCLWLLSNIGGRDFENSRSTCSQRLETKRCSSTVSAHQGDSHVWEPHTTQPYTTFLWELCIGVIKGLVIVEKVLEHVLPVIVSLWQMTSFTWWVIIQVPGTGVAKGGLFFQVSYIGYYVDSLTVCNQIP